MLILAIVQKSDENSSNLVVLMRDCQRLVQMFYPGISQSAGCIYSSAIPFMPACELHFRYQRYGTDAFTVRSGRLQDWPAEVWCRAVGDACHVIAWSTD